MPAGRPVGAKTRKRSGASPARRFTLTERERMKAEAQRLDLQGFNGVQIAERLNVSPATARGLLDEVQQDYLAAYVDNRRALVMRETAVLLDVRRTAYEEMNRLKEKGRKKRVVGTGETAKGPYSKDEETVEDGEINGFLQTIIDTNVRIARLWGLEELPKVTFNITNVGEQTNNVLSLSGDDVLKLILEQRAKADPVEQELAAIENLPAASTTNSPSGDTGGNGA